MEACKNDGHQQEVIQISRIEAHQDEVKVVLCERSLVEVPVNHTVSNAHECAVHEEAVADVMDVGKCGWRELMIPERY